MFPYTPSSEDLFTNIKKKLQNSLFSLAACNRDKLLFMNMKYGVWQGFMVETNIRKKSHKKDCRKYGSWCLSFHLK
jgi:hypothetical protein